MKRARVQVGVCLGVGGNTGNSKKKGADWEAAQSSATPGRDYIRSPDNA